MPARAAGRGASRSTPSRPAGFYQKTQLHDCAQVWDFGLYRLGNVLQIKDYPQFPLPNTGLFTPAMGLSHRP
ncbi:hypothetical protein AMELA_G00073090 [Ameiurus melas]|uniref:Uncharacterized protein n=1 Tax=Ameiurus melas TaxID=219545 RepID=A0A7J6AZP7_AMEME|nr:hypothetical protein AMELA_G00073090 [Ameiurus melas]